MLHLIKKVILYRVDSMNRIILFSWVSSLFLIFLLVLVKFIYSEKATKFCEIFFLLLSVCTVDNSKGKISQNFVPFSEYTNFI